jgi:pimeloyl-ACP methyl ester carboxylesterase
MSKTLVVLVPDYRGDPAGLAPLKALLLREAALADALWLDFDYRQPAYSNRDPEGIAENLNASIEAFVHARRGDIEQIILAGHSMGSTLVRRAFLDACGYGARVGRSDVWPGLVTRIVLLGAFGRGFSPRFVPWRKRLLLGALTRVARTFGFGRMLRAMLRGADYISRLRIDWVLFNRNEPNQPRVIHLLGSNDPFIRAEDVIDLEEFPNATPVRVPGATHASVVHPGPETSAPLVRAFVGESEAYKDVQPPAEPTQVFFLMHGIRDSRECFARVAEQLDARAPSAKVIVPTYGYLSARRFLSDRARNNLVPWFIDQISEQLAQNPSTTFCCAGHSNGTYILGEVLRRFPRLRFERLYLAASVLPADYPWRQVIGARGQVGRLRCDMGSADWPVGVLCRALYRLGKRSIGAGGADGFEYGDRDIVGYSRFAGGHGAMLSADNAQSIVEFLLSGEPLARTDLPTPPKPPAAFTLLTKYGDVLLPVLLAVLVLGVAALALWLPAPWGWLLPPALALVIWIVLGRF